MGAVLNVANVSINFGGVKAVDNITLEVANQGVTSIIGPNGAGKTTFFNIVSGIYKPTGGTIEFDHTNIAGKSQHVISHLGMARTFQNIRLFRQLPVLENILVSLDARSKYGIGEALLGLPSGIKEDKHNRSECVSYLELVGLAKLKDEKPNNLPYGMQRKLELARALATKPKLLLLDEPAAGLNPTEVEEFIALLNEVQTRFNIPILLIEHRLQVVYALSQKIYVFNFGKLLAQGTATEIQNNAEVIKAYMGEDEEVAEH